MELIEYMLKNLSLSMEGQGRPRGDPNLPQPSPILPSRPLAERGRRRFRDESPPRRARPSVSALRKGIRNQTEVQKDVEHVFQNKDPPKPGDMIHFQMLGFQHWGIYVGDQEVVHFAWPVVWVFPPKFKVRKEKNEDVQGALKSAVWNKFDKNYPPLDPDHVVERALHMVGKILKYDPGSANCEHFATLMRYDAALSGQAERFNFTADPDFVSEVKRYLSQMDS
ncbi:phospholipase A and acyltransferase 4-like [Candoia aspera]|uniref:phospholipase A and acyltransferase 4-like n=1 Tax=Candoia aspera TaxID=51853 RepID=UPI002FD8657A